MLVNESIAHGEYVSDRTELLKDGYMAFVQFVRESPYGSLDLSSDNQYLRKAYLDLVSKGVGSFGWATYRIV